MENGIDKSIQKAVDEGEKLEGLARDLAENCCAYQQVESKRKVE